MAETSTGRNQNIRRLIVVQIIVAILAIAVTFIAGHQISTLMQEREDLSRQVAEQKSNIKNLKAARAIAEAERTKAEAERAEMAQQLTRSRFAADHARRGINHYQRGEFAAAIVEYNKAIRITPDNAEIYDWLAFSEYRNGNYTEALHHEEAAVQLDPSYARGYYNMAIVLWRIGRKDDAMSALRRMSQLSPRMVAEVRVDEQFAPFWAIPEFRRIFGPPPN